MMKVRWLQKSPEWIERARGNHNSDYIPGGFDASLSQRAVGKQFIRQRLAWIVSSKHDVNPSRSTLQSVNAFLM